MRKISVLSTLGAIEELVYHNLGRSVYSAVYRTIINSIITINEDGQIIYHEKNNPNSVLFQLLNNFPAAEIKGCDPIEITSDKCVDIIHQRGFDVILGESNNVFLQQMESSIGVCHIAPESESFSGSLSLNYFKDIIKDHEYILLDRNGDSYIGWSFILKDISLRPSNSLIIQDNYIFSLHPGSFLDNITNIIKQFLHPDLVIPFELLIVSLNGSNEGKPWYEDHLNKLITRVRAEINTNFTAGILIHPFSDKHHKRLLISNLSLSKSDWGFNAFSRSKSYHDNDIYVRGLLVDQYDSGDSPIGTFNREVEKIKNTLKQIKALEGPDWSDPTRMIIGNCDNRLIAKV